MGQLALNGGERAVDQPTPELFAWPIVNQEMEQRVLDVLRAGAMSGTEITRQFERAFADWHGVRFGLGHNNGTSALEAAMYAIDLRAGDEIIAPSITYWATCLQALKLGAKVVFADIDPETLCIDPDDIERRITPRTKAIALVHYLGVVADMDRIMDIARRYGLKVIEDVSHAHGSRYHDQMAGTFGDVACYSLMSSKGFAVGEAGMLLTNDRTIYERAVLYGHYVRHDELTGSALKQLAGLPLGGCKNRMHQMSAAVGLAQLKKFPDEMAEIDRAMKYFWRQLEDVPGIRPIMADESKGNTTGAWYFPHGHYDPRHFGGLPVRKFCAAIEAEGSPSIPGVNAALHRHPVFSAIDIYGQGHPSNQLSDGRDVSHTRLPVAEGIRDVTFGVPWFKHCWPDAIEQHAAAIRKVAQHHKELLDGEPGDSASTGHWGLSTIKV